MSNGDTPQTGSFTEKDYTTVNFSVVGDMVNEWSQTASEFSSSYQKASEDPTLQTLGSIGIAGDFASRFDTAMETLVTNVNGLISAATGYFSELGAQDATLAGLFPPSPSSSGPGGNTGPGNGPGNGPGGGSPGNDEVPDTEPGTNPEENLEDNYDAQMDFLDDISMSDLQEVLATLNTVATDNKMSIDELLNDEKLGASIKSLLLKNPKISEQYKAVLNSGSSISAVKSLKSLVNGEVKGAFGLDEDTLLTMKSQLSNIARDSDLSYEDLLASDDNSSILKTALSGMKNTSSVLSDLTKENVQNRLLEIYDGTYSGEIDDVSLSMIRSQVDVISSLSDINYEELLTVPDYSEELLSCTERLQRTSMYADLLSNCKSAANILSSLIK